MIKEYFTPKTVAEAVSLKKEYPSALYFAGGTEINNGGSESSPERVISLSGLELDQIKNKGGGIEIGAMTVIQEICNSGHVPGILKEAAGFIVSRNIRNIATIGGNIAVNSTESYLIPALCALSAKLETSNGKTSLYEYITAESRALILKIIIPENKGRSAFRKVSRTANFPAAAIAAVSITESGGKIVDAVIALGGVNKRVARLTGIEDGLKSGELKPGPGLEKTVSEIVLPEDDLKGSADYKRYIAGVVVSDCVKGAL